MYLHNNSAYSKVATGPLWKDMRRRITEMKNIMNADVLFDNNDKVYSRFILYSGHDSTIMSLLASLGRNMIEGLSWAAYASMFVIEVNTNIIKKCMFIFMQLTRKFCH